jgi:hypothetical protein
MDQEAEDDRIRRRAYELWVQSGQPEGSAEKFWLQAEREVKGESPGSSTDDPAQDYDVTPPNKEES